MLHICERCGRCDARDADHEAPCCSEDGECVERDWRADAERDEAADPKHITEQLWVPEQREDGVYRVGVEDRSVVLKLCRPDRGSDLLLAGYVMGLQGRSLRPKDPT